MGSGYQRDLAVDLARRLRAARTLSGKKAPELAHDLGWSTQKIYRFEQGRQVPDVLELREIAEATGQNVDFFLGTSESQGEGAVLTQAATASQEAGEQ
jgi:transcriptional regulator with XRE-family HTH domain